MPLPAPVAYISSTREMILLGQDGTHTPLTHDPGLLMWGAWGVASPDGGSFSWPTWSPDGRRIACFRLPTEEQPSAKVVVMDVQGVESQELADLGDRIPIYLFWAPGGQHVAMLSQVESQLHLTAATVDASAGERRLAQGSPLFFTWAGRDRLAAFVGNVGGTQSRLAILDPDGLAPIRSLPGTPGNFCAPLWLADRVVYVLQDRSGTRVVSSPLVGDGPAHLETVDGLVALVASPDGKTLARAVAPEGDGTPYRHIALIDVATGALREVLDLPCLAYMWAPTGDALVVARVDTRRNLLEWLRVDLDGQAEHLCDMYPTRDLGFYLRFFEQYTQSHHLIDPSGKSMLLPGNLAGRGDRRATPRIWHVELDTGAVDPVAEGVFAVFGPRTP